MTLFAQHPLQRTLHHEPTADVTHQCPVEGCKVSWQGNVREVLDSYREHVIDEHMDLIEDCGCCGQQHFIIFRGDCREDWERF